MIFSDVLQFHCMSMFALPLGLNPDPGTMNFPILGEVYMDIMDHIMHLLFYQIYIYGSGEEDFFKF